MTVQLPDMPDRIAKLPTDRRGYPVPWFVAWLDPDGEPVAVGEGEPDFRVIRPRGVPDAYFNSMCWVCGEKMGRYKAYTIGPMCAVNRTSAEPPSHRECAEWSAKACPFLTRPHMRRRENNMPTETGAPPGIMLKRNPGAILVWIIEGKVRVRAGVNLFDVGEPTEVLWFAEGREATREEVLASLESGLPTLRGMAEKEGPRALAELDRLTDRAMTFVPA